jgi:hypothetical protein
LRKDFLKNGLSIQERIKHTLVNQGGEIMAWTADTIDHIYELYGQHIQQLRSDVITANRLLGSSKPEKTALRCLTRAEFESLLNQPTDDPQIRHLWLRRIIRGHEQEFPDLGIDSREIVEFTPLIEFPKQIHRKTGT